MATNEQLQRVYVARRARDTAYLVNALCDSDADVRQFAAQSLGVVGDETDVPALLDALARSDPRTQASAARALGRLRATAAVDGLIAVARSRRSRSPRVWSLAALGEIGEPRAYATLVEQLDDDDWLVRRAAVYGLGELGEQRAVPVIKRHRQQEPWYRHGVHRQALRKLRYRPLLRRLRMAGVGGPF